MTHVLVCDDAADLRLLMQITLESSGHRVTTADGGIAALQLLGELDDIDVIVLDVQMPAVDGWHVLEAVRNHPFHQHVPVLMCTVKFSHEDLVHAWTLGCDGYLNKPFDLDALTNTVQALHASDLQTRVARRHDELKALASSQHS
ncbi:two-component response regulator [Euzebya pacifica]|uniref:Two-component response regulator n=1 Tax=Euzebya pacifica TaxID=1608957 RepID=A0A346XT51_9ACTN|nr:response regulator [Euzebya pacifica]AXV05398.1 two-component response regulator [Euzebya pacifica]